MKIQKNKVTVNNIFNSFDKTIYLQGDKSLSIRWALLSSLAQGKSKAKNLLLSEDVLSTLNSLKKLGVKVKINKNNCEIIGQGINGYKFKSGLKLNAGNSGTFGRLILALLASYDKKINLVGDKSLSKRDFYRITKPLSKFGAKFITNSGKLPIKMKGTKKLKPITYIEDKGSAQCKSSVMLAALKADGQTIIKAKKSRDHTELLFKYLKIPISVYKTKYYDLIKVNKVERIKILNYNIPSDISSSAFFIALTILTKNSKLCIKNINVNPTRIGIIKILSLMGIKIILRNVRFYKGEKIADLNIKSAKIIRPIKCPSFLNSSAIDEFLIIFLVAAKANGISYFTNLSELNEKESPRLKWGSKILNLVGIRTQTTNNSIKIYGNPNLKIDSEKKIVIKNYLKDHRVFMTSVIASLVFGGKWTIHDRDSIKTSFPTFLKILKKIKS